MLKLFKPQWHSNNLKNERHRLGDCCPQVAISDSQLLVKFTSRDGSCFSHANCHSVTFICIVQHRANFHTYESTQICKLEHMNIHKRLNLKETRWKDSDTFSTLQLVSTESIDKKTWNYIWWYVYQFGSNWFILVHISVENCTDKMLSFSSSKSRL